MTPLTLFHGSSQSIETLTPDHAGRRNHPDGLGIWFTEGEATAADFARRRNGPEPTVHVAAVALANPLTVPSFETLKEMLKKHGSDASAMRAALKKQGYDGIVIDRSAPGFTDTERDFIAFDAASVTILERRPVPSPRP